MKPLESFTLSAIVAVLGGCSAVDLGRSAQPVVTNLCGGVSLVGCSPSSCLGACCSSGDDGSCDAPDNSGLYRTLVYGCPGQTNGAKCDGDPIVGNGGVTLDDFTDGHPVTISQYADAHPEFCTFQIDIGYAGAWTGALDFVIWQRDDCAGGGPPVCTTQPTPTVSAEPILQPPNHEYHTITVPDDCQITWNSPCGSVDSSSVAITCIGSDEPDNGLGDGDTPADIVILDNQHVRLRAERSGTQDGRCYTIHFQATDASGNVGTGTCIVGIPHGDQPVVCGAEDHSTCDTPPEGGPVCTGDVRPEGIDVSLYTPDWSAVRASKSFAYAETPGPHAYAPAASFAANWPGMRAAGIRRGAYYFFWGGETASVQTARFESSIQAAGGLQSGDLPLAVDVEEAADPDRSSLTGNTAQDLARLRDMLEALEIWSGRPPVIYTNWITWKDLGFPSGFEKYPLWEADPKGGLPGCSYSIPGLPNLKLWQYQWNGDTDLDKFNGSEADLTAFAIP